MSHMIEMVNGLPQMAYRKAAGVPWHGLGVPVDDDMTPEQMMNAAGVNWTVSKVDTFYDYGGKTVKTGVQALVRDTDGKLLTQVGPDWNPVQNHEAFDFFTDFVKKGDMIMDTAGSLKEGRIVWALADVKDGFTLFNGDEVKGYLLFSNPHLYGNSIDVKFVLTRVVCNNTIAIALNEKGQPSVRVNHRAKFDAEKVKEILGLSHRRIESFKEKAEYLGSKTCNVIQMKDYFKSVFGSSSKEDKDLSRTAEDALEIVHTQPGANFKEGTWWPVFNTVTYMTDHKLGRSVDSRMTSAWFGGNAKRKLDALDLAIKMAEAA